MDGTDVQVFIVSDMVAPTRALITLQLVSLSDSPGNCRLDRRRGSQDKSVVERFHYDIPGLFATRVWRMDAAQVLKARPGCTAQTCYLSVTAEAAGTEPTESQLWFTQFKNMQLPDPAITIEDMKLLSPLEVNITVRSQRPAALVMLSAAADRVGHFTDNGFNLDPCEPRTVTYISHDGLITEADLKNPRLFTVDSLFDHSRWDDVGVAAKQAVAAKAAAAAAAKTASAAPKNGRVQ